MFLSAVVKLRGASSAPRPALRVLAALLVLVMVTVPAGAAFAEPAPGPVSHTDHIGGAEATGCLPLHDDAFCVSCRVLVTPPLSGVDPAVSPPVPASTAQVGSAASRLPDGHVPSSLRARAPPRS